MLCGDEDASRGQILARVARRALGGMSVGGPGGPSGQALPGDSLGRDQRRHWWTDI